MKGDANKGIYETRIFYASNPSCLFDAKDAYVKAFELEKMFDKQMRTLSGGTTQKVSAVLAFLFNPEVLILDEPTAGLDPVASEILKEKINDAKKKGCLVLKQPFFSIIKNYCLIIRGAFYFFSNSCIFFYLFGQPF